MENDRTSIYILTCTGIKYNYTANVCTLHVNDQINY